MGTQRMIALILAWTLSWTMPATMTDGKPINCPLTWTLFRLRPQSPTWAAHAPAINARCAIGKADTLLAYWPRVVAEDQPQQVASGAWLLSQVGKAMSVTFADTSLHGTFFVTHTNAKGECVNWSNLCTR